MKTKAVALLMTSLFLLTIVFSGVPSSMASPAEVIKVGVIGPQGLPHWSPGMKEASEMAVKEINDAGGIAGGAYTLALEFGNEYALPVPDPLAARAEAIRLITVAGCHILMGGFRTETTQAIIEACMDYGKPFFIDGAATTELISQTVALNYPRYKYLFRNMPPNITLLINDILTNFGVITMAKLLPIYGQPEAGVPFGKRIPVAVLTEDLAWTVEAHLLLTSKMPASLQALCKVVYSGRVPETATDCKPWITAAEGAGARVLFIVISGRVGLTLISQWKELESHMIPYGINVLGQIEGHWTGTLGKCEYETILNNLGTETPIIPGKTDVFWKNFYGNYTAWPIYVALGAYDFFYALKQTTEYALSKDPNYDPRNPDKLVPWTEQTVYLGQTGMFKYTGPHPMGTSVYDTYTYNATHSYLDINPNMDGTLHDFFIGEVGPMWTTYPWGHAHTIQWQKDPTTGQGRMEVVSPMTMPYSKKFKVLPWTYPSGLETLAETDTVSHPLAYVNGTGYLCIVGTNIPFPVPGKTFAVDGTINPADIGWATGVYWLSTYAKAAATYGASNAPFFWNYNADLDGNGIINILDLAMLGRDWGKSTTYPL